MMVFFTLQELVKWLGMTVFEFWLMIVSVTVFSLLLVLKIEEVSSSSCLSMN